jgi:hypothetical protein
MAQREYKTGTKRNEIERHFGNGISSVAHTVVVLATFGCHIP